MRPFLLDPEGPELAESEFAFFREFDPWGFILFANHCREAEVLKRLCGRLRESVGRNAPILIDQEGGRVARLKPPRFVAHPPAALFGLLWRADRKAACEAAKINAILLGRMCADHGINVNAMPVLDVADSDSDPISIGDRAFSDNFEAVVELGQAAVAGCLAGGVLPVVKHLPGLGRTKADTHFERPLINATRRDLLMRDMAPFSALSKAPIGMTNHACYSAYDSQLPTTISPTTIELAIRNDIGFDGVLLSDAILMGGMPQNWEPWQLCQATLTAGCDIAVIPHLTLAQKDGLSMVEGQIGQKTMARIEKAERILADAEPDARSTEELYDQLDYLLDLIQR